MEGPGNVGQHMDEGLQLMEFYTQEFEKLENTRIEMGNFCMISINSDFFIHLTFLVNAEKLFDIDITDYSEYLTAKTDFENMQIIYKLYDGQKSARETWSKTLWVNLNPQALIDGIENFIRDFRKLPIAIKEMPVAKSLEVNMKQFKNIVPLMVKLKNEALRERHWKLLMNKTGKSFNMAPEKFTLENMFSMDLYKYQEIVETIVSNAIEELKVEKCVNEIGDIWEKLTFNIVEYQKEGEGKR